MSWIRSRWLAVAVAALLAIGAVAFVGWPRDQDHAPIAHVMHPSAIASAPAPASAPVPQTPYALARADVLALQQSAGTERALARLSELAADDNISAVCHALAHDLGHVALAAADGNVAVALTERDDVCGGGFIHGVIERALGDSAHPRRDLLAVCAPVQEGTCWHGVGHGAMFATGMDVDASLALCDRAPSVDLRVRCGEGVFMQLFNAESVVAGTVDLPSLDAAHAQCTRTPHRYAANCWFYAPNVWLAQFPEDFTGAMRWCSSAPSEVGRDLCARGVGSRTIKRHATQPSIGEQVCAASGELMDACLGGMASYWSVHWEGERSPRSMCRELTELRERCRAVVRRG